MCAQPTGIHKTAVRENVADKAGAVKGCVGIGAAPHIRIAEILFRLGNQRCKLLVVQVFRVDIVVGGRICDVLVHIGGVTEQILTVAQHRHIRCVHGKLFLRHDVDRDMGEIEVFELHVADVVVIRDAVGFRVRIAVCIRPCVGLRAVSGFDDDLFCEDILLFKQHLERTLHLIQRKLALVESRENGDQHIGVMLNIVQIEVVFIVAVSAFVGVEIALQLLLHLAILRFRAQHRVILAEIGGCNDCRAGRGEHRTRADSGTEQNEKGNSDADPDEDLLVFLKKLLDLVGHLFTELLAGILCGSPGSLRTGISSGGIFLLDVLLLVVLVHVLLLHLRMLLLISFILELRIHSIRLVFQLGDLLIRLVDALFPMMTEMPSGSLSGDLRLMRRLNRRVFLFDLMDFAVNAGSEGVTDLADGFICFKLQLAFALWLFQLILKMKAGFALAGLFIKNALLLENLVRGQLLAGSVQTLMRLF